MGPGEPASKPTVLLAEDDGPLRNLILKLLTKSSFVVIAAIDGQDALTKARAHSGKIDLLVTDIHMPFMSGLELARQLCLERPPVKVLLMSALSPGTTLVDHGWHFLQKPFPLSTLHGKIQELLSEPERV